MNGVDASEEERSSSSAWNSERLFSTKRYMRLSPNIWHILGVELALVVDVSAA